MFKSSASYVATLSPRWMRLLKQRAVLTREAVAEANLYWRDAAVDDRLFSDSDRASSLECQITKDYHRIEKGLALGVPKRPFGAEVQRRIEAALPRLSQTREGGLAKIARDALRALQVWNDTGMVDGDATQQRTARDVWGPLATSESEAAIQHLFTSRRSVRQFREQPVAFETVQSAVALAANTPSVCNRQAWSVHAYFDEADVAAVLEQQDGNSGFRSEVPCVLVVTADRRMFAGPLERNQAYVDGGMFAMSLGWALHAVGLATCMLNWSRSMRDSARLREVAKIPENETIITMIAVGYPPETFRVARSKRRDVSTILVSSAQSSSIAESVLQSA